MAVRSQRNGGLIIHNKDRRYYMHIKDLFTDEEIIMLKSVGGAFRHSDIMGGRWVNIIK